MDTGPDHHPVSTDRGGIPRPQEPCFICDLYDPSQSGVSAQLVGSFRRATISKRMVPPLRKQFRDRPEFQSIRHPRYRRWNWATATGRNQGSQRARWEHGAPANRTPRPPRPGNCPPIVKSARLFNSQRFLRTGSWATVLMWSSEPNMGILRPRSGMRSRPTNSVSTGLAHYSSRRHLSLPCETEDGIRKSPIPRDPFRHTPSLFAEMACTCCDGVSIASGAIKLPCQDGRRDEGSSLAGTQFRKSGRRHRTRGSESRRSASRGEGGRRLSL